MNGLLSTNHRIRKGILIVLLFAVMLFTAACNRHYGAQRYVPQNGEEQYFILLSHPSLNDVFTKSDRPPRLEWNSYKDMPNTTTIEIDYLHNGTYLSREVAGLNNEYQITTEDWEVIIKNAPVAEGIQKVSWRIRIDYSLDKDKDPYYSDWGSFFIVP